MTRASFSVGVFKLKEENGNEIWTLKKKVCSGKEEEVCRGLVVVPFKSNLFRQK